MKGLKRNLKYWLGTLEKVVLSLFFGVVMMAAFVAFISDGNFMEEFGKTLPLYLLLLMLMTSGIKIINCINSYLPLTVSMGSERKSSFVAMEIALHLTDVEILLLCLAAMLPQALGESGKFWLGIALTGLTVALLIQALGSAISTVSIRFGQNVAGVVCCVLFIAFLASLGYLMATSGENGITFQLVWEDMAGKPWIVLIGILLDGVMTWLLYRNIRRKDLQFA